MDIAEIIKAIKEAGADEGFQHMVNYTILMGIVGLLIGGILFAIAVLCRRKAQKADEDDGALLRFLSYPLFVLSAIVILVSSIQIIAPVGATLMHLLK